MNPEIILCYKIVRKLAQTCMYFVFGLYTNHFASWEHPSVNCFTFWCFQEVQNERIGEKWVNHLESVVH